MTNTDSLKIALGKYGARSAKRVDEEEEEGEEKIKTVLSAALVVVDGLCGTSSGHLTASDPLH